MTLPVFSADFCRIFTHSLGTGLVIILVYYFFEIIFWEVKSESGDNE